ncbi:bifunctional phosphopantothenoylcysteine decarboxylase/phosphopantothenate--cysteine ligase CoaBC [Pseudobdellovibrio exovorus]|uniref:Coenzyme A biosynthesis bifunctional protein CoaBC n=1 Tax=Pseudobdellovibrio exovorus JSS TaxID=1184267 RepID=M4VTH2_9BACT|nr:bifunctional phosphopantothenoylcysteine decarboxylase/phosphopantothenate--cysteine ligase CoaBC [Pseudobdellovibrio exovorus]AGH96479.1 flavoprotein [Pseudobdellovibrio exovorus JSS]
MSPSNKSKNILIVMTGSIACYKVCTVMSRLKQAQHHVKVVMSPSSLAFVGAATVEGLTGEMPITDMYARGNVMDHINLVRWADLILVAPATANYINKIAYGLGDDLLTTLFLAHDFAKPFLLAPAMNTKMYQHPTTQDSIKKLRAMGVEILETASGVLACGEVGSGRLLEPDLILEEVYQRVGSTTSVTDKSSGSESKTPATARKVLITAGGTSEAIDDVRVITNRSTGRTAAHLADILIESGFKVTYLHSTQSILPQNTCNKISYDSFTDLQTALKATLQQELFHVVIHAAAVSDYSVQRQGGKISSQADEITLTLKKNPKIIDEIKKLSPQTLLFGFKLTSKITGDDVKQKVQSLLKSADCDFVVQNDWDEVSQKKEHYHVYNRDLQSTEVTGLTELGQFIFQKTIALLPELKMETL